MITVLLYGHLAEKFGRTFKLSVKSPAEAVRALCAVCPGFKQYVSKTNNLGYRVIAGKSARLKDDLHLPIGASEVLRIVPVILGSGPIGRIILGVILIVWSFFPQFGGQPWMATVGWSMVIGGVSQLLFAAPSAAAAATGAGNEKADNRPSYTFDGAVNTAAQGNPVPLCYGRMLVGSQVISAGLSVEQI